MTEASPGRASAPSPLYESQDRSAATKGEKSPPFALNWKHEREQCVNTAIKSVRVFDVSLPDKEAGARFRGSFPDFREAPLNTHRGEKTFICGHLIVHYSIAGSVC